MTYSPIKRRTYGAPKDVIARLFDEVGGVPAVMRILELSRTRVYAFADPDERSEISFARVARLTEETGASAAAKHLSHLAGGVFLPVGPAEDGEWHALAGEAARRNAQTIASFLDALAEDSDDAGEVSPAEARELLRCVDLQLSLLAKARAKLCDVAAREAPAG